MGYSTALSNRNRTPRATQAGAVLSALGFALLASNSASAALREYRVQFEPSASTAATGYTMHVGQSTGAYAAEFDLGNPPAAGGTIVYAVDLEDSVDLFVSLRAYDLAGEQSAFSNEVRVSAILPPPTPPPSGGGGGDNGGGDGGGDNGGGDDGGGDDGGGDTGGGDTGTGGGDEPGDGGMGGDGGTGGGGLGGGTVTVISADVSLGVSAGSGGLINAVLGDGSVDFLTLDSLADSGSLRPVRCDLDGDGDKDLVLGFGPGSAAQVAIVHVEEGEVVSTESLAMGTEGYREESMGKTFPACGDLDGDGLAEIVVGFGAWMRGRVQILDDEMTGYAPLVTASTDADGFLQIPVPRKWRGPILPAVGDIDGDGRGELVAGLGRSSKGRVIFLEDPMEDFVVHPANTTGNPWVRVLPRNDRRSGRSMAAPATGDFDGDGVDEIAVSFGYGSRGRVAILEDARGGLPIDDSGIFMLSAGRGRYKKNDGATRSTFGDVDGDGVDELIVGFRRKGAHELQVFDDISRGAAVPMSMVDGFVTADDSNEQWFAAPDH